MEPIFKDDKRLVRDCGVNFEEFVNKQGNFFIDAIKTIKEEEKVDERIRKKSTIAKKIYTGDMNISRYLTN